MAFDRTPETPVELFEAVYLRAGLTVAVDVLAGLDRAIQNVEMTRADDDDDGLVTPEIGDLVNDAWHEFKIDFELHTTLGAKRGEF